MFRNYILRKAEEIKKKEASKEADSRSQQDKQHRETVKAYEDLKNARADAALILLTHVKSKANKIPKPNFEVGDVCILNKYNSQGNNWDGGFNSLLICIKDKGKITSPVKVRITSIGVDYSYTNEIIGNYLRNFGIESLRNLIKSPELLITGFDRGTIHRLWSRSLGAYMSAHFEPIDVDFKPQWGLSVDAFVKLETPMGRETFKVWKEEIEIETKMTDLREKLKKLEIRKRDVGSQFKVIKA